MDRYFSSMPYAIEWMNMFNDTDFYGWVELEIVDGAYDYIIFEKNVNNNTSYHHDKHNRHTHRDPYISLHVSIKGTNNEDVDEDRMIEKMHRAKRTYPHIKFRLTLPDMDDDEVDELYNQINQVNSTYSNQN